MSYKNWKFDTLNLIDSIGNLFSGVGEVKLSRFGEVVVLVKCSGVVSIFNGEIGISGTDVSGVSCEGNGSISKVNVNGNTEVEVKIFTLNIYGKNIDSRNIEWNKKNIHLKNAKVLNQSQYKTIGGYDFRLSPLQKVSGQKDWDKGEITLVVEASTTNIETSLNSEYFHNFCGLLTMAQRCPTFPVLVESFKDDEFICAELIEKDFRFLCNRPLTDWFGDETLEFLHATHNYYFQHLADYGLHVLCEYYWRSHMESTVEIKMLYASIFMEALKFNWAANVSQTLEKDLKANGLVRGFRDIGGSQTGRNKYKNKTFEELMILLSQDVGYPAVASQQGSGGSPPIPGTYTFIENRNAIFHSGMSVAHQQGSTNTWQSLKPELEKLYNQMDDLLLRILNYNGIILPVDSANPNLRVRFPSRNPVY